MMANDAPAHTGGIPSATPPPLPHLDAVVGIGASAGGLEALQEFLDNLPAQTGCAFVVVQHLSPDHPSLLAELLAKHTPMPVLEATQGQPLHADRVYVIPPGKVLRVAGSKLVLDQKSAVKAPASAVDIFFHSLAEAAGKKAVSIILSGTGSDGTRGLQAVKEAGGYTIVQDPLTARFDGMPTNAIAAGTADLILAPELMPEHLLKHVRPGSAPVEAAVVLAEDRVYVKEALDLVFTRTGCDFRSYKAPTIHRRIHKRMGEVGVEALPHYLEVLRESEAECRELCREFLIGVTRFFRDPLAFDALRDTALLPLVNAKPEGGTIKCWVTACSTGEEAYTLAMLLSEVIQTEGRTVDFKIFATDIDESAIQFAAKGIYSEAAVRTVPADLLSRYFAACDGGYQVTPELRKRIVFARHSIIKDPAFIKNDLVSCRNLLIYFTDALQRKVLSALHYALNPGGYLFLGASESAAALSESIVEVSQRWKLFQKGAASPEHDTRQAPRLGAGQAPTPLRTLSPRRGARPVADAFRNLIADELGVALIHLNDRYEVKEATGAFKQYLTLPADRFDTNVLRLLVPDLSVAVGQALRSVAKGAGTVRQMRIRVRSGNTTHYVNAVARAVDDGGGILLMLSDSGSQHSEVPAEDASTTDQRTADYLLDLQAELKETKEQLQAVVEDLETTNEELQSSNEELLSANEELQSSNEELQSLNEELHTLNTEHQMRIRELQALNEDLDNYFRSVETGQIFVDGAGRVRNFNPAAQRYVNLIATDVGRTLADLSSNITGVMLDDVLPGADATLTTEREIVLKDDSRHLMRVMPYLRGDGRTDGAVLTFTDVTQIRLLDEIVKGVFEASQSGIIALKATARAADSNDGVVFSILALNSAAASIAGQPAAQLIGQPLEQAYPSLATGNVFARYSSVLNTGVPEIFDYPKQGEPGGWWQISAVRMDGGLAITISDITEARAAEEKLRQNYNSLLQARESLRAANASLEDTVQARTMALSKSEERFRLVSQATAEGLWDWNFTNGSVWWSEGFYVLAGRPMEEEDAGISFKESRIHPDDRARILRGVHGAINAGHTSWSGEYRFRRADGSWAQILDRASIHKDEHNTPVRMLGSMLDVTALRRAEAQVGESEARTRLLADNLPLVAWSARRDGHVDFLNRSFEELFSLSIDNGLGSGWQKIVHPDSLSILQAAQRKEGRRGQPFALELQLKTADGKFRWYALKAAPQKDDAGRLLRWVGSLTDIQPHKAVMQDLEHRVRQRTRELEESNADLERSNTDLQQFASVASHDLKEPLRKIVIFGNLARTKLAAPGADPMVRDYATRMVSAAERMTRLVNDLLSFSRLSANMPTEPTDLNVVLREVLEDLDAAIVEKDAHIEAEALPTLNVVPGQMRQLFQNLLANGLKFSRPGINPRIAIRARRVASSQPDAPEDKSGTWWRLDFSDNGIGFEDEFRERIFTIFQRLHGKEQYEGTGIGLAIARKIVERHNGRIAAEGRYGEGATFTIILPAAAGQ